MQDERGVEGVGMRTDDEDDGWQVFACASGELLGVIGMMVLE